MKKILLTIIALIFIAGFVKADTSCLYENITSNFTLEDNYNSEKTCFQIISSNVVFDCAGYKISGPGALVARSDNEKRMGVLPFAGIRVKEGTTNVVIKNCRIQDFNTGIELKNELGEISQNLVKENKYGIIFASGSKRIDIKYNIVSNNIEVGIDIKGTEERNLEITDNTIEENKIGIKEYYCVNPQNRYATGNNIEYNLIKNNEEGIYLGCLKDGILTHNLLRANEIGIKVAGLKDYSIKENQIFGEELQGTGIKILGSEELKIIENTFQDLATGIGVSHQDQSLINSEISNNSMAVGFGINAYSENNNIFSNSLETRRGMNIKGDNNLIKGNTIGKLNQVGIYTILAEGDNNTIEDNCLWEDAEAQGNGNTIETDCYVVELLKEDGSIIENTGTQSLNAYLRIKIQVNNFGTWRDNKIILGGIPITIAPGETYSIKEKLNSLNPELRKISKPNRYRLHIILTDYYGNILKDSLGNKLEATQEFSISTNQVAEPGDVGFFESVWDTIRNLFN